MKTILVFDDEKSDDMTSLKNMLKVNDWISVVDGIANNVRSRLKYGHNYQTPDEALEALRDLIAEELSDRQLSLY